MVKPPIFPGVWVPAHIVDGTERDRAVALAKAALRAEVLKAKAEMPGCPPYKPADDERAS